MNNHYFNNVKQGNYNRYNKHNKYNNYNKYNETGYNISKVYKNSPHQKN